MPSRPFELDTKAFHAGLVREVSRRDRAAAAIVTAVAEETAAAVRQASPSTRVAAAVEVHPGRDAHGPFADILIGDRRGPSFIAKFLEFGTSKAAARPFARPQWARAPRLLRKRAR